MALSMRAKSLIYLAGSFFKTVFEIESQPGALPGFWSLGLLAEVGAESCPFLQGVLIGFRLFGLIIRDAIEGEFMD